MIPVLFISIHYVFLTLSLPLYNFQKKISVQDCQMKSPFFHLKFWHILHLLMYLGKYPVWFF